VSSGEHYAGSPFLGLTGILPQGHPGLNTTGGYYHMWHSHNEKEITTDDIFPGGMMTQLIIEPWGVDLDAGTGTATAPPPPPPPPPALPTRAVIDNFNRASANTLGAGWQQLVALGAAGIRVNANQASCPSGGFLGLPCPAGGNAYRTGALGASQAAALTFVGSGFNNVSLLLKASGAFTFGAYQNAIRVRYTTADGGGVVVEAKNTVGQTYTPVGTLPASTVAAGDTMTAMVDANGTVYVWMTTGAVTALLGSAPTGFSAVGGQIGMYLPPNARIDNFAGGTP
jgi:hypothetical protein